MRRQLPRPLHTHHRWHICRLCLEQVLPRSGEEPSPRNDGRKLPIHFEYSLNDLRSLRQGSSASSKNVNHCLISTKIVQRALVTSNRNANPRKAASRTPFKNQNFVFARDSRNPSGEIKNKEISRALNSLYPCAISITNDTNTAMLPTLRQLV